MCCVRARAEGGSCTKYVNLYAKQNMDVSNTIVISSLILRYKGDAAQVSDQQQRQDELDVLRQQASRAEELEVENDELRRKLLLGERGVQLPNDSSNGTNLLAPGSGFYDRGSEDYLGKTVIMTSEQPRVSYEEHESLKSDYGKLFVSHKMLQEKYRRAKEISKAWRKYDGEQKLRQEEKRRRTGLMDDSHHSAVPDAGRGQVESANAPSFGTETICTPSSLSVTPKTSSPRREAIPGTGQVQRHKISDAKPAAYVEIDERTHLVKDYGANGVSADIGQCDVTQTSDESMDPQVELQLPRKSPQEKGSEGRISGVSQGDECSDCPVIVLERPVKRKRSIRAAVKEEVTTHQDWAMPPGSVAKPIRVKSEQNSSSPVVQVALDDLEEVQGTLDLDEVGDRALTPRKRRRLQQLRIRPQGFNPSSSIVTQSDREQQANGGREDLCATVIDERDTTVGHDDGHHDLHLLRDRAYYVKFGEEHGLRLWEEERRKAKCRQDAQANLDATVTDRLRGTRNSTLPRQRLHNRRVHARHAKGVEGQQAPLESFQQATPTHQARHDHGLGTVNPGKTESEQAARASSEPIEALKSQKQLNSAMKSNHLIGPTALRPTNPNVQVLPRTSEQLTKKWLQPPSCRDRGIAQIPSLAEDGEWNDDADEAIELPYDKCITDGSKLSRTPKVTDLHCRLGTLLAESSPGKPPLASEKAGKPFISLNGPEVPKAQSFGYDFSNLKMSRKAAPTVNKEALRTPQPVVHNNKALNSTIRVRDGRFGYPAPTTSIAKRPSVQNLPVAEAPGVALPEDEPLRARPLRRLRLDDFKVNPASNQGYDYAFDEVVRNRDQRKCLPNCTRPECCGTKFQKMVELGGFVTPRKQSLWSSSPVDEAEEEVRLLKEYLGYDRTRISRLPEDGKRRLVIQAKANRFANEHGRHRQAYERNTSPPGFWRTDMPTTQELEEDREAAQQMTGRKLEERYREAMRPGGRWMFRDE